MIKFFDDNGLYTCSPWSEREIWPILVGVTSLVSELWVLFVCLQNGQNLPSNLGL